MTDQEWDEHWKRYGFLEMVLDMRKVFPPQRGMEMFTWMLAFGAAGGKTHGEMVQRLLNLGFTKTPVYQASKDIKKFQAFLMEKWGREVSREDLAKKISEIGFGSTNLAV